VTREVLGHAEHPGPAQAGNRLAHAGGHLLRIVGVGARADNRVGDGGVDVGDGRIGQVDAHGGHLAAEHFGGLARGGGAARGIAGHIARQFNRGIAQPGHLPALLVDTDQQRRVPGGGGHALQIGDEFGGGPGAGQVAAKDSHPAGVAVANKVRDFGR
jgi:hypothetical protein